MRARLPGFRYASVLDAMPAKGDAGHLKLGLVADLVASKDLDEILKPSLRSPLALRILSVAPGRPPSPPMSCAGGRSPLGTTASFEPLQPSTSPLETSWRTSPGPGPEPSRTSDRESPAPEPEADRIMKTNRFYGPPSCHLGAHGNRVHMTQTHPNRMPVWWQSRPGRRRPGFGRSAAKYHLSSAHPAFRFRLQVPADAIGSSGSPYGALLPASPPWRIRCL